MFVKRNSFFGFVGFLIPTLVLLVAYPVLVRHLGMQTLGLYLLATSMSGALAFLDAGFSAATLKFVAEDLALGRKFRAAETLVASLFFYGAVGMLGTLVLWLVSPWLVTLFKVEPALRGTALIVFRIASVQFAVFFTLTVFISLFKGMHRFHLSTLSISLLSVLTYGGAVVSVLFTGWGVIGVTAVSLAANVIILIFSAGVGLHICAAENIPLRAARPTRDAYKRMLAFGSFMTVNGIATLLLLQIQKYLIGATLGPAAVGVYQTGSVPPSKIHAAVNSATEVLFPMTSATKDPLQLRSVYLRIVGATTAFAAIALLPLVFLGPQLISLWLGKNVAPELPPLLTIFAIAYFFQALGPPAYHLVNGLGKPWINTISSFVTAILNVAFIGVALITGPSLTKIAWAFAGASFVGFVLYQAVVELVIWRRLRLPQAVAQSVAGL